jgi:putative membrane-bound dehydrogenase-like protein
VYSKEELEARLNHAQPHIRRHARLLLDRIARDGALPTALPYPVQSISFGSDLVFVFLGGEVVVDFSLRLKRELDCDRFWPVAYANDVPCYIPSARIVREKGYESDEHGSMLWYGQPGTFKPEVEEVVVKAVHEAVPDAFRRPPPPAAVKSPVPPEESLKLFEIDPGFVIELAACEPQVVDPIHLSWDAKGRMYVTEMIDYPEGPPAGRVVRLEDADGDGRYESGGVFADGLAFPTSATPWRNGVLVSAAPDILYLEDADGDGKADVRRRLFTGFGEGNTQHRINNLQWGLDNWFYGCNGDSSGRITSVEHPERPAVEIAGADFRFKPDTGEFEILTDHGGYNLAFDDWGNRFVAGSTGYIRHVVIDRKLIERNPYVPAIQTSKTIEGRVDLHPISGSIERFNDPLDAGHFTSAAGLCVYRGGIFPESYRGNLFIGEPMGNLVHRDALVAEGPTFRTSTHAWQKHEFLASRDPWFRPVYLATGPDGCLYVADMYRAVIEHPEWIPNDIEKTLDLKAGDKQGRIYRIWHRVCKPKIMVFRDSFSDMDLIQRLADPNGWVRDTAQRMIVDRMVSDDSVSIFQYTSNRQTPEIAFQALQTLIGLGLLTGNTARGIRVPFPNSDRYFHFYRELGGMSLVTFPSRDQVVKLSASVFSEANHEAVSNKWGGDWIYSVVCLSEPDIAHRILEELSVSLNRSSTYSARMVPWVWRIARGIGNRNDAEQVKATLDLCLPKPDGAMTEWQMVVLGGGLVMGAAEHTKNPGARIRELAAGIPDGPARLERSIDLAAAMAEDVKVIDGTRYDALRVLGIDASGRTRAVLKKYLDPAVSPELQDGAIGGAADLDLAEESGRMLLERWPEYGPGQRRGVLDAIFRRHDRIPALLEAMEKGVVGPADLEEGRREQLRKQTDGAMLEKVTRLLAAGVSTDRQKVVADKQGVLALTGRRAEGLALFNGRAQCSQCHPVQGVGPQVGPDLVSVRKRERGALLMDILDPNASTPPNFIAYTVTTKDGVIHSGLMVGQSAAGVTLRQQGGGDKTVPRGEIESVRATGRSLMPEGLETTLSDQDLADIIEYLRQIQ